jgi:hypothetical protein
VTGRFTPRDLAVLIPVLGRPHHIPPLLASLDATVPGARVLFLVTPGDEAVPACEASGREVVPVTWRPGDFARKCQVGYGYTTEPLLFIGATDLQFEPGWFEAATAELGPGVGVVGTNDMCNPRVMAGEHATHFLMTRAYVDRYGILQPGPDGRPINQPGVILFDGYAHEFCDTEAVATAVHRGAFRHAATSVVRHRHKMCDQGFPEDADDPSYAAQAERMRASWPLFRRRQRLWGGPPVRRVGPIRRRRHQ